MNLSRVPSSGRGTPYAATQLSAGGSSKPVTQPKPGFNTVHTYGGPSDFEALPQHIKDAIQASPMVRTLGMEPHSLIGWGSMNRGAGESFEDSLNRLTRHVGLSLNSQPIPNSEKFSRLRLPTDPGLPSVPQASIPTPATNVGGRRRVN